MERALAGQGAAAIPQAGGDLAFGIGWAAKRSPEWIGAPEIVIVEIFITERQALKTRAQQL